MVKNRSITELEQEVDKGLNELKTWAGNDENTPNFVEAKVVNSDEQSSFDIIPSHVEGRVEAPFHFPKERSSNFPIFMFIKRLIYRSCTASFSLHYCRQVQIETRVAPWLHE